VVFFEMRNPVQSLWTIIPNMYLQGAICQWGWWGFPPPRAYTSFPLLNYFYYFHHYIVIINNQNTKLILIVHFDLPGVSQRHRARRKQFYFENQPDFLAFYKSNFLSASSAQKTKA